MSQTGEIAARLTPRAVEVFDTLLEEVRDEILEAAHRRSIGAEISARDVIEAFDERVGDRQQYARLLARRRGRIQLLLFIYAATAGILAATALVVVASGGSGSRWIEVLAASSIGILSASVALIVVSRRREMRLAARREEAKRLQGGFATFMDRWLRIESLLRLLVSRDLGKSVGDMPLGAILDASMRAGKLDYESYEGLKRLLAIRNEAVHGGAVDGGSLTEAIQAAELLVARLENRLAR